MHSSARHAAQLTFAVISEQTWRRRFGAERDLTAEVVAESMFEAAVLGLAAFRKDDWTEKIGPATRLHVAVHEPVVSHTLTVQQIHRSLEVATISPLVLKKKLKEMLTRG